MAGILTGCVESNAATAEPVAVEKGKVAVVYYSWSPSGNTRFGPEELRSFMDVLKAQDQTGTGPFRIRFGGVTYLAGIEDIHGTDWQIVLAVPTADVTGITQGADRIMVITMLILIGLIIPVIALTAHNILKPIYRLQDGVNAISRGDYSVTVPHSGNPELDRVVDSFNSMREQTQVMMKEQYRMGQDLKSKELQVLQEQIL